MDPEQEKMDKQIKKFWKYSRSVSRLLIASGLYPGAYRFVQRVLNVLSYIIPTLTLSCALTACADKIENVLIWTKTVNVLISVSIVCVKITVFLIHGDDLLRLNQTLAAKFKEDLKVKEYQALALTYYPIFSKFYYTLTGTVGVTAYASVLLAFISPCDQVFPFELRTGSLVWCCLQVTNCFTAQIMWTVTTGVDGAFGVYTLQMCGELRILAMKFRQLRGSANYKKELKECIERHHLLMASKAILERVIGVIAIYVIITCAVSQCILVFQARAVSKI